MTFDLLLSRSDYARTNTGWLNFQKIIHPVFIFNEFATLRLFFRFLKDNLCELHLREQFFCRNKPINPVLIVRKLQYDYRAF